MKKDTKARSRTEEGPVACKKNRNAPCKFFVLVRRFTCPSAQGCRWQVMWVCCKMLLVHGFAVMKSLQAMTQRPILAVASGAGRIRNSCGAGLAPHEGVTGRS